MGGAFEHWIETSVIVRRAGPGKTQPAWAKGTAASRFPGSMAVMLTGTTDRVGVVPVRRRRVGKSGNASLLAAISLDNLEFLGSPPLIGAF